MEAMQITQHKAGKHYVVKCSCGAIISQCRCMSPNKEVIVQEGGCNECKAKVLKAHVDNLRKLHYEVK